PPRGAAPRSPVRPRDALRWRVAANGRPAPRVQSPHVSPRPARAPPPRPSPPPPPPAPPPPPRLGGEPAAPVVDVAVLRASRRAMATTFEVLLPFGAPQAQPAAEAALDLIDDLEDQLTVFRDHSEVSRLNATAVDRPVEVQQNLFDLIEF